MKMFKRHKAGTLDNVAFSDEKIFTFEVVSNHPEYRILSGIIQTISEGTQKIHKAQKLRSVGV